MTIRDEEKLQKSKRKGNGSAASHQHNSISAHYMRRDLKLKPVCLERKIIHIIDTLSEG